jgi:hypothetical protein
MPAISMSGAYTARLCIPCRNLWARYCFASPVTTSLSAIWNELEAAVAGGNHAIVEELVKERAEKYLEVFDLVEEWLKEETT